MHDLCDWSLRAHLAESELRILRQEVGRLAHEDATVEAVALDRRIALEAHVDPIAQIDRLVRPMERLVLLCRRRACTQLTHNSAGGKSLTEAGLDACSLDANATMDAPAATGADSRAPSMAHHEVSRNTRTV